MHIFCTLLENDFKGRLGPNKKVNPVHISILPMNEWPLKLILPTYIEKMLYRTFTYRTASLIYLFNYFY